MKTTKRLFLATAVAFGAFASLGTAQAQTALDDVMKAKTIKIAIPTDFPPYGFVGTDLQPQGLDVDTAKLIASKLGVKVELVPVTSANRIPYLQTRKADLVISTLGKNAERLAVIDFTAAYSPFFQAVFAPKSLTVASFADLAGKTIGVTRGAIEDQELTKLAPATADVKRFEDNNATVSAFVSGQTQLIATGASVAGNMMARNPQLGAEQWAVERGERGFGFGADMFWIQTCGNPENFYMYQIGLMLSGAYQWNNQFSVQTTAKLNVLTNFDQFNFKVDAQDTGVPRVRTYVREYVTRSDLTMENLFAQWKDKLADDWYAAAYAGYLETMYGGIGAVPRSIGQAAGRSPAAAGGRPRRCCSRPSPAG